MGFDDASERARWDAALALDNLICEGGAAGRPEGHRSVARGLRAVVDPFAPRKVLEVSVLAHRDEWNLRQVGVLALPEAVRAFLAALGHEL